ncbi:hypothetical protein AB0P17_28415 [Streptomyces sp. NPDC088124]|uniref:hypothetical protein n=1 Tax=Streptomyces sp. NPDC088124 TaxID=3154654 RepID=UPI0034466716
MKSARVFVVTVLCAMMVGAVAGTAAAETGNAGLRATSSVTPDGDTGWGRVAG